MTNSHNNTLAPAAPPEGALWSFWEFLGVIDCGDPSGSAFSPELHEAIARARSWDEQSEREALLRKRREAMAAVRAMVKAREKIGQGSVSYDDIRGDVLALDARYKQPIDHFSLSPRFRQVVGKAKEALRNKTVRVFQFEDVDGITELREVFLQFSEHMLLEAGAMQISGGDFGFLRALDHLYGRLFIPVEDARVFLSANSPETPEPITPMKADDPAPKARKLTKLARTEEALPRLFPGRGWEEKTHGQLLARLKKDGLEIKDTTLKRALRALADK
jgi:hypothetical protein